MKKIYLLVIIVVFFMPAGFAQVTVTNPANTTPNLAATYTSLANAITALNSITAISGPVAITLSSGNPQTAPAGGYTIQFNAVTTAGNNITFNGNNNIITASAVLTSGQISDGIFKLVGADYITIQDFTMRENPANTNNTIGTNNMTEWGIALLHASVTNGAQHNTITNNTISLNRAYQNTFGIYSNTMHGTIMLATPQNITSAAGANSGNQVYGNNISNVAYPVIFVGSSTTAFMDDGNDIGGSSLATGNTLTNWGPTSTIISGYVGLSTSGTGILLNHQANENASFNTMVSATLSVGTNEFNGIDKVYSSGTPPGTATSTINNNTITISSSNLVGSLVAIRINGITGTYIATQNINNNLIENCTLSGVGASGSFVGIADQNQGSVLNINNNTIRGISSTATSGGFAAITNIGTVTNVNITNNKIGDGVSGAYTNTVINSGGINCIGNGLSTPSGGTVNINNNSFDGFNIINSGSVDFISNIFGNSGNTCTINVLNNQLGTSTGSLINFSGAQSGDVFPIYISDGGANITVNIQENDIRGIVHTVAASCTHQYITGIFPVKSLNFINNTFTGITANTTGNVTCMVRSGNMLSGAGFTCTGNSIVTGYTKTGTGGQFSFLSSQAASVNGSAMTVTGNNCSNVTVTGPALVYPFILTEGASSANGPAKTITGNTISTITGGSGEQKMIWLDKSAASNCSSNIISDITGTGNIYGIVHENNNGQGTINYSSNAISGLISSGTNATVDGIYSNASATLPTLNFNNNVISGLSASGDNAVVNGIDIINGAASTNIYDNTIDSLSVSGSAAPAVNGVSVLNGTVINIYRNKITALQATGAIATVAGVNGMLFSNGTTVTAHNNFIADLKAPNANLTDAIRGIAVTSATASSSYNLYYNSVYLNAGSTGTNFGTAGVYAATSPTATTAKLDMIDNIIVNTSTPNGLGVTAAYKRTDATLANYATTSDYNLFYAGTPSATKLIFYDGTNSDQALADFQARVSPRDANDISVMPDFASVTDLHLTSNNCSIDNKGIPVAGVTTDIDAAIRDITTPDIGADEFVSSLSGTLAGLVGAAVCENKMVSVSGTSYYNASCDLIARVLPSGGSAVSGNVNACVTRDASIQTFNAEPYVARHFDIEPAVNPLTSTARVTLYFTNQEFVDFNTASAGFPLLPTVAGGGNADPNIANLKITQYHGTPTSTPSSPGMYTVNGGEGILINPADADIVWNGSYWAVTVAVTGFSGFYVHTNVYYPLTITLNYLRGIKQGSKNNLSWKVTCNSIPKATLTLERSSDATNFTAIYTITADALRCQQPFDYLDADPVAGKNYYRLKMVDNNGKITYSNTIALLNATKGFEIMNIAPNPVTGGQFKLNVTSAEHTKLDVVIMDMQGRVVQKQTETMIAGYNSLTINIVNLAAGTYNIYGTTISDKSKVIRFVKR